jgi:hypothetical protein
MSKLAAGPAFFPSRSRPRRIPVALADRREGLVLPEEPHVFSIPGMRSRERLLQTTRQCPAKIWPTRHSRQASFSKRIQDQQVFVSRYNEGSTSVNREFENRVVVGIAARSNRSRRVDNLGLPNNGNEWSFTLVTSEVTIKLAAT